MKKKVRAERNTVQSPSDGLPDSNDPRLRSDQTHPLVQVTGLLGATETGLSLRQNMIAQQKKSELAIQS